MLFTFSGQSLQLREWLFVRPWHASAPRQSPLHHAHPQPGSRGLAHLRTPPALGPVLPTQAVGVLKVPCQVQPPSPRDTDLSCPLTGGPVDLSPLWVNGSCREQPLKVTGPEQSAGGDSWLRPQVPSRCQLTCPQGLLQPCVCSSPGGVGGSFPWKLSWGRTLFPLPHLPLLSSLLLPAPSHGPLCPGSWC